MICRVHFISRYKILYISFQSLLSDLKYSRLRLPKTTGKAHIVQEKYKYYASRSCTEDGSSKWQLRDIMNIRQRHTQPRL